MAPNVNTSPNDYLSSLLYNSRNHYPDTYCPDMYGRACIAQYVKSERMAMNYLHFVETMLEANNPMLYMFVCYVCLNNLVIVLENRCLFVFFAVLKLYIN
jgi:hypothetical protein